MAGQLTLGGGASNIPGGSFIAGPSTVTGTKSQAEIINVELEAGVEKKVPLPSEAVQWAAFFQFQTAALTVTVKTNAAGDGVMSFSAQGFVSAPIAAGVTELAFKAATAPKVFQLVVI